MRLAAYDRYPPVGLAIHAKLKNIGLSREEAAKRLNCKRGHLHRVIWGQNRISEAFALDLEEHLGLSADWTLERQLRWRLDRARESRTKEQNA